MPKVAPVLRPRKNFRIIKGSAAGLSLSRALDAIKRDSESPNLRDTLELYPRPDNMTEDEFFKLVASTGRVRSISFTGNKCIAVFQNTDEAQTAKKALTAMEFNKPLHVNYYVAIPNEPCACRSILISHIDNSFNSAYVKRLFSRFGAIESFKKKGADETEWSGVLTYASFEAASKAVASMNGIPFTMETNPILVGFSSEKRRFSASDEFTKKRQAQSVYRASLCFE